LRQALFALRTIVPHTQLNASPAQRSSFFEGGSGQSKAAAAVAEQFRRRHLKAVVLHGLIGDYGTLCCENAPA
jgi:hypothetical protein